MNRQYAKQLGMKGYWIYSTGKIGVTFHVPSFWDRAWAWLDGEVWIPYR